MHTYSIHCIQYTVCAWSTFFAFFIWISHNTSRSLIISHAAGRGEKGNRGRVRKLIHFWGPKQNEYFLYFLRNTGHKIDVTFVLALEKYGRNMAALGSYCQLRSYAPLPTAPLPQGTLFVPRNWQWKVLAPAETTFQFESARQLCFPLSLSLSLSLPLSCLSSLALSTAASRWQWVREIYRPQHILGFGLTSPRLARVAFARPGHGCQATPDTLARHLSLQPQLLGLLMLSINYFCTSAFPCYDCCAKHFCAV